MTPIDVVYLTAQIFEREPEDAAEFVDASRRILEAWRAAQKLLGEKVGI